MNDKAAGWKRVLAIIIDGLLCAFIVFVFITVIVTIINAKYQQYVIEHTVAWESEPWGLHKTDPQIILIRNIVQIFQLGIPIIFLLSPIVAHGLVMSMFRWSAGSEIMGITVKNSDGSKPPRSKYLKQALYGLLFSLSLGIISVISGFKCLSSKQTITDKKFDLQAFKK